MIREPIRHIIENCISEDRKKLLLIVDDSTERMADAAQIAAEDAGRHMEVCRIPCVENHGRELPPDVSDRMLATDAVMCMTRYSFAHSYARSRIGSKGIPFLSMPDYNEEMLKNPAVLADYHKASLAVDRYAGLLSEAATIRVTSDIGTDLMIDVTGRTGNSCPGFTDEEHLLGSPPDIEANISPVEPVTHGVIAVDGSVTDRSVGLLNTVVYLHVENGAVKKIVSEDPFLEESVKKLFQAVGNPKAYIVGELGIGFNDRAELCGNMLIDEGTRGCVHFGIGSNWTIGGQNRVDFHLDFVIRNATVETDGRVIIHRGELLYEHG